MIKQIKYNRSVSRLRDFLKNSLTYCNGYFYYNENDAYIAEFDEHCLVFRYYRLKKYGIDFDLPSYIIADILNEVLTPRMNIIIMDFINEFYKYDDKTNKIR